MTRAKNRDVWIIAVTAIFLLLSLGQATQGEETPNTSVTGKVLMPDGSPAAGATVELRNLWWDRRPITTVKTDESGAFKASPPVGKYLLHAILGDLVAEDRRTSISVETGGSAGPYELKLEKGCVVSGVVTEKATGKPMEGVRVITDSGDSVETSATGSYSLVLPRRSHRISALKDGFYRPIVEIAASGDTRSLSIELRPGLTIKGKVTDSEGKPVVGARVGQSRYSFYFENTKTNDQGEYVLAGFDPDSPPEISARADGFESVYDEKVVFTPGATEATLDFKLDTLKTRMLSGRVTTKDGKPAAGATVTYGMGTNWVDNKTATTDADGRYAMEVISQDKNIVMAQAKGFAPAFGVVPADVDAMVNLVLEPGHYAEGQVEDEDGKPLRASISVSVQSDVFAPEGNTIGGDNTYSSIEDIDTDEKGHFRLDDLPREGVVIQAYADEDGYAGIDGMPLEVDRKDHILVMYRTGEISGKVVSAENDSPITKFTVATEGGRQRSFESPDGTFTLKSYDIIPGNKVTVGVGAPGYQRETKYGVEAKEKADYSAVFRLKRAHDFEGTVTDGEGRPLEGVLVTARYISSPYSSIWYESENPSARTDANGRFKIAAVPMDAGRVILEKPGYGTLLFTSAILRKPLTVTMQKAAVITGKITDEAGKPLPGIRTEVYAKRGQVAEMTSDDKGGFRFENLLPGKYRINADDYKAGRFWTHTAEVRSGEVYEIDWDKPGEAELEGKVTRNGQPVAEASVLLFEGDERMWCAVGRTDAKGAYSVTVPKVTEYHVNWHAKNYEEGHGSIQMTMKPGKNHLDMELPGASVSGKVLDQSTGKPIANSAVSCLSLMTSEQIWGRKWHSQDVNPWFNPVGQAKTDDKGRFTFQYLVPGECAVALEVDQRSVPGPVIKLGKNEQKTGVIVRIPPTGQAQVKVVEDATGKSLEDVRQVFCVSEQGFSFSPASDPSSKTYELVRTPEGKLIFPSLPPGKYTLRVDSETHLPASGGVTFKVQADQTADVTLRMRKSERIVFRLTGDHLPREALRLGYRITSPEGKPVLNGYWGPTLGSDTYFNEELEACIPVKPGTYQVQAALMEEDNRGVIGSTDNLWSTEQTVKVQPGKDTVIEVEAR